MNEQGSSWRRHFFYRKESLRTTWKLRLSLLVLIVFIGWITRSFWTQKIGQSLTCQEQIAHSEALLLENFDPDYLVFERAAALQRADIASRIFVPVQVDGKRGGPNIISKGLADLMARVAHIPAIEVIPMDEVEPISLNAALQIRDYLTNEHVRSVIVVTPGFRSTRSFLVYNTVLSPAGINVGCVPVFGLTDRNNWTKSWHGIQDVALQFMKLQYYRFYVL